MQHTQANLNNVTTVSNKKTLKGLLSKFFNVSVKRVRYEIKQYSIITLWFWRILPLEGLLQIQKIEHKFRNSRACKYCYDYCTIQ